MEKPAAKCPQAHIGEAIYNLTLTNLRRSVEVRHQPQVVIVRKPVVELQFYVGRERTVCPAGRLSLNDSRTELWISLEPLGTSFGLIDIAQRPVLRSCGSAWKRDPVSGVIGVE